MIGENRFSNSAIRAVAITTLIVGFLAVAFVSVSADEPCIPCLATTAANRAYAARYTALAESFAPAAAVEPAAECSLVDHELMFAGGYASSPGPMVERGADFDFVDHELMVAGGYALVPGTMVETGIAEVTCGE